MNIAFNIAANLDRNISGSGIDPKDYEMERTYLINGINAYTQYGLVFKKGTYNQLLEMPTAWPEDVRKISLPIAIIATNESSFWQKYYAFRALMTSGAEFILQVDGLYRRFKLKYKAMSDFAMLTYITQENKVASSFILAVDDDYPDAFTYTRIASFQKMNATPGNVGSMVSFSRIYTSFSAADALAMSVADTSYDGAGLAYANLNGTNVPLFDVFTPAVVADGGTFNAMFSSSYAAQNTLVKSDAVVFLAPGAVKTGRIYAANNKTGAIAPITFTRAGVGSYVDSNGVLQVNGAAVNVPRISYDMVTKALRGYLLEGAGTNLARYSNDFANIWTKGSATIQSDGGDGWLITTTTTNNAVYQVGIPVIPNTVYTFSFYAKTGTMVNSRCSIKDNTSGLDIVNSVYKDLINSSTYTRVSVTVTTPNNCTSLTIYTVRDTGEIGTVFIKNVQLEAGSVATTYIPTVASQVTRPADVATIPLATDGYVFMQTTSGPRVINAKAGTFNLSDAMKAGEALQSVSVFNRSLTEAEIIQLGGTRNDLMLSSAKYNTATVNAGTFDETLFNAEFAALPALAKTDSEVMLIPGAYKTGSVYGVDRVGNLVPFTFTRSGTATYFDKNGVMQTAAVNVPRISYDPVTKAVKGYLLENAGTNLALQSNDFSKWTNGATAGRITLNYSINSYGQPFSKLEKVLSSNTEVIFSNTIVSTANTTYCFRITLRASTSNSIEIALGGTVDVAGESIWGLNENATIKIVSGPGTTTQVLGACYNVLNLSTTIDTVIEVTRKYTNGGINASVRLAPNSPSSTTIGDSVLISCAQLETGSVATSYIPTVASQVTRIKDDLQSVTDIVPYAEASLFMNFRPEYIAFSRFIEKHPSFCFIELGSANNLRSNFAPYGQVLSDLSATGVNVKVLSSYSQSSIKIIGTGKALKSSPISGLTITNDTLKMNQGIRLMHVKALAIFKRQLTDTEHTTITA